MLSKRLSMLSSNEQVFNQESAVYNKGLRLAGYKDKVSYIPETGNQKEEEKNHLFLAAMEWCSGNSNWKEFIWPDDEVKSEQATVHSAPWLLPFLSDLNVTDNALDFDVNPSGPLVPQNLVKAK